MTRQITVIGTGYVGLVTGACLSDAGFHIICADNDEVKINNLQNGLIPIYEPGLDLLVTRNYTGGRLTFTTDIKKAVQSSEVIFIAVGTPTRDDGSVDLGYVQAAAHDIAANMNSYKVIVHKSTVPVGTGQIMEKYIKENQVQSFPFALVSNPEFLREGSAVYDFMHPDRIVIGAKSDKAVSLMKDIYHQFLDGKVPLLITDIETAETIKYASNAFLALKVTFINELSALCERLDADIEDVSRGMGLDNRIGSMFLKPGPGYGGSCFPKDTRALAGIGQDCGIRMSLVEAVVQANEEHKLRMIRRIENVLGDLTGKRIGILGLAFKAETDDTRESPAITIIAELNKKGAEIKVYDPQAMNDAKYRLTEFKDITYCENEYHAAENTAALVIMTEWGEFKKLDFKKIRDLMNPPRIFDFRNLYNPSLIRELGFDYYSLGRR